MSAGKAAVDMMPLAASQTIERAPATLGKLPSTRSFDVMRSAEGRQSWRPDAEAQPVSPPHTQKI